jgi:hypothetical protein
VNEPRDRDDIEPADADERLARDAVRGLPRPTADPAFRARLKADFARGAIEGARVAKSGPGQRPPLPLPWGQGRPSPGWRATAAIAAAIIGVVAVGILNQGPMWRIAGVRGSGIVRLDGVAVAEASAIGRRVPAGVRVEVSDGAELDLRADGVMAMECTAGTDLVLPPTPPRWFARRADLHVQQGEIRVVTGPRFPGARLAVTTPDAALQVTGTTFAVILEPTGTCVCVYEGRVMVGPRGGAAAPVTSGNRRYVFRDKRPVEDAAMRDVEHVKLAAFRDEQMAAMAGNGKPTPH